MIKIPIHKPVWGNEEQNNVLMAMNEGYLNEGKYVKEFERKFAEFVGARYCLLVPNGAIALYMGIQRVRFKSETMRPVWKVPDYYGIFATNALIMMGFGVLVEDVMKNGNLSRKIESPKIVVHNNGRIGDTWKVEDCCQAISHHTKDAISCYSFHPSKLITCGGIGGAVCCDDEAVYTELNAIKDHGRPERAQGKPLTDHHTTWGTNFKVSDLNAAFGLKQLERLPQRLSRLREVYKLYQDELGEKVNWIEGTPSWRVDCLVEDPQKVIDALAKDDIEAKRFYLPTHAQPLINRPEKQFPVTMSLYKHGLYLPCSSDISDEQVKLVCEKVKAAL